MARMTHNQKSETALKPEEGFEHTLTVQAKLGTNEGDDRKVTASLRVIGSLKQPVCLLEIRRLPIFGSQEKTYTFELQEAADLAGLARALAMLASAASAKGFIR